MADKDKSGIELLRELANDVSHNSLYEILKEGREDKWGAERFGGSVKESLLSISGRIEREHAEELAAKRDLTDEARAVVERLRAIDDGKCTGADRCWEILIEALGADSRRYGAAASWQYDMSLARDRLIELIENGGKQDADVAALRELADELDFKSRVAGHRFLFSPQYNDGIRYSINDAPERIRKAVEGAPKPDAESEAERECGALLEWCGHVADLLGIDCESMTDEVQDTIMAELDKRLMPPRIEWPRLEDGGLVCFGSIVAGLDGPCEKFIFTSSMGGVCQLQDADGNIVNVMHGERVKRPDTEALGADGLLIEEGDTVYTPVGTKLTVREIGGGKVHAGFPGSDRACYCAPARFLSHTPPDTQARIDFDATIHPYTYCNEVLGWDAHRIVRRGDLADQIEAMIADLLRRQRELDAKTTG